MVRQDAHWKVQDHTIFDWAIIAVGMVLSMVYLYRWGSGSDESAIISIGLLAWGLIYFTDYWQPILYFAPAIALSGVTIFWLWKGQMIGLATVVATGLNILFVLLAVYLFFIEEPTIRPKKRKHK